MRVKLGLCGALAIVLAVPVWAVAGDGDKATGGGQILFASQGAGNTIAFTAQEKGGAAKGQVQFIDRTGGRGRDQVKYHGTVECIEAAGNAAKIAGTLRNGDTFNLYVEDTGEGQGNSDVIFFDGMADDPTCEFDTPSDDDLEALARGNAQVRDGQLATGGSSRTLTYRKALTVAGLR